MIKGREASEDSTNVMIRYNQRKIWKACMGYVNSPNLKFVVCGGRFNAKSIVNEKLLI